MPVIATNTAANTAVRFLNQNSDQLSDSLAKLASGSRITTASDDAAGLAVATKLSSDVTALEQAATNATHGISILQTADGGAANVSDILERMKTLASQAASGTVTDTERAYVQAEFAELMEEIDDISTSTRYNGQSLLDGTSDFADDTVETAAEVDSTLGTGAAAASVTTTLNSDITIDASSTLTFEINGTSVSLSSDASGTIALADVISGINNADTGVTASIDDSGYMVLTSDTEGTAGDFTIDAAGGTTSTIAADITLLGITDTSGDDTETFTGTDASSLTLSSDAEVSFDVVTDTGTTTVTLSGEDQTEWTADDIAEAISDALIENGDYTVEVEIDEETGALTMSSRETGEDATFTIDNFSGYVDGATASDAFDATDLGLTETATGEVTATGTTEESETTGATVVVGSDYTDTITLTVTELTTSSLGIDELDVSTQEGAEEALAVMDMAIDKVSAARAEMGATVSRFEFRSTQLETSIENLEAAESAISDVDIASEQAALSAASVKVQAAVAAASQANQMPENLLKLLQ